MHPIYDTLDVAIAEDTLGVGAVVRTARSNELAASVHAILIFGGIAPPIVCKAEIDFRRVHGIIPEGQEILLYLAYVGVRAHVRAQTGNASVKAAVEVIGHEVEEVDL